MLYRGGLLAHSLACAVIISLLVALDRGWLVRGLRLAAARLDRCARRTGSTCGTGRSTPILSEERTGLDGATLLAVRLAVSVLIAYASFRLVEDPIRRRAPWALGRSGMVVLAASVVGAARVPVRAAGPAGRDRRVRPRRDRSSPRRRRRCPTNQQRCEHHADDPSAQRPSGDRGRRGDRGHDRPDRRHDRFRHDQLGDDQLRHDQSRAGAGHHRRSGAVDTDHSVLWAGRLGRLRPGAGGDGVADRCRARRRRPRVVSRVPADLARSAPTSTCRSGSRNAPPNSASDVALMQISNWDADVDSDDLPRRAESGWRTALEPLGTKLIVVSTPTDLGRRPQQRARPPLRGRRRAGRRRHRAQHRRARFPSDVGRAGRPRLERRRHAGTQARWHPRLPVGSGRASVPGWPMPWTIRFAGVTPGDPAVWADALWVLDSATTTRSAPAPRSDRRPTPVDRPVSGRSS